MNGVDQKIVDRVKKLLNLARDGGATEAEADLAMERAQSIMMDHNLSMAMVELSGGQVDDKRQKDQSRGKAGLHWQRELMSVIAETCYCHLGLICTRAPIRFGATREMHVGYEIIGRISNVTSAKQLFDYMLQSIARLRREFMEQPDRWGGKQTARDGAMFSEGMAHRLCQRIVERHRRKLREQEEAARRQQEEARARGSSGNELVVVMNDYAQDERDLNEDLRSGLAAGTTSARRKARQAEAEARERHYQELKDAGIDKDVAWYMSALGYTREKAEATNAAHRARQKIEEEQPRKETKYRWRKTHQDRVEEKRRRQRSQPAWQSGAAAGDSVSLDEQVPQQNNPRLK